MSSGTTAGDPRQLEDAVAAFVDDIVDVAGVAAIGDGNINDTYLVRCKTRPSLVLQRINAAVFPNPQAVAENTACIARHLNSGLERTSSPDLVYRFPKPVQTISGADWHQGLDRAVWRSQTFIEHSTPLHKVTDNSQPYEAGRLLGYFHRTLASFNHKSLQTPLPGFHDLTQYRRAYIEAGRTHQRRDSPDLGYCRNIAEQRLEDRTLDERARDAGIEKCVIHGDPKCDNFLFDDTSGRAVSLIDLDTTASGLAAVDIGDCLRSFCNPGGEKSSGPVSFDIEICRNLIDGYHSAVELSTSECSLIYHGVRLMTYELGLRFFTDYLGNDRYFKVTDEAENLRRAVVQFKLLESIEAQRSAIESIAGC